MALAHPTLQQEAREAIACDYFIDAMDDADLTLKIRERAPPTLDEALRVALQLEAWMKDARRSHIDEATRLKPKVRGAVNDDVACFSERFDRLEADIYKRFNELLELREASVVKPEATAVKAPAVNIPEPNIVAQNGGAVTSQRDREHVAP